MKKLFLLIACALFFGVTFNTSTNAQVVTGTKKVVKKGNKIGVVGVRKTNRGLHKGWYKGKRVGQKSWRKGKGVTVKGYRKGKRITVKGIKKVTG
jgi:hypothetical protein